MEINNREDLKGWLAGKPREICMALAARAALRVLPVPQEAKRARAFTAEIVLSMFRATGIAWFAAKYPNQATRFFPAAYVYVAAATAATRIAQVAYGEAEVYDDAPHGDRAAAYAAAAYAAAVATAYADAAYYAAEAVSYANSAEFDVKKAVSNDATRFEEGTGASAIAALPLWPQGQLDRLVSLWQEMKHTLRKANKGWEVWIDWYERRLKGEIESEQYESAFVDIEEELWKKGPATVNSEIKRRIAELGQETPSPNVEKPTPVAAPPAPAPSPQPLPQQPPPQPDIPQSPAPRTHFTGFFSYAHIDAKADPHIVEAFSSQLERRVDVSLTGATFDLWLDQKKLNVGDYWDEELQRAIETADVFIILLTPKWIDSSYCRKEFTEFQKVESARNSSGYIIPIYVRDINERRLDSEKKTILESIKKIHYKRIVPREFVQLSNHQQIAPIEDVSDPIVAMIERLRG